MNPLGDRQRVEPLGDLLQSLFPSNCTQRAEFSETRRWVEKGVKARDGSKERMDNVCPCAHAYVQVQIRIHMYACMRIPPAPPPHTHAPTHGAESKATNRQEDVANGVMQVTCGMPQLAGGGGRRSGRVVARDQMGLAVPRANSGYMVDASWFSEMMAACSISSVLVMGWFATGSPVSCRNSRWPMA